MTAVEFAGAEVEVTLERQQRGRRRGSPTESRASIGSLSLLGEPIIDISPATAGTPLKDGDTIETAKTAGQIADVAAERHPDARTGRPG